MSEDTALRPAHVRRRAGVLASGSVVTATGVAALMVGGGHRPDPWTAVLVVCLATAVAGLVRGGWLPRGQEAAELDEVDPETGVGNARAVLALLDREAARARTYDAVHSVAVLEVDRPVFAGLHPRRARRLLVDIVRGVATDVRVGDRVSRVSTTDRELVVVVLPDTGATGAHTFADRMLSNARRQLLAEGAPPHGHVRTEVLSHPDDVAGLRRLRRRVEVLEGTEALIRGVTTDRAPRARRGSDLTLAVPDPDRAGVAGE